MQQLDHKNPSYSEQQLFFVEKAIELLHRKSIDTYRSRAMNPKTILLELRALITDDRIVNPKAADYAIEEARLLLKDNTEDTLNFDAISKSHFIGLISDLQKNYDKKIKQRVALSIDALILENNKEYGNQVLKGIEKLISEYKSTYSQDEKFVYFEKLQKLISYFITELVSNKFSKRFLFRYFSDHFASHEAKSFEMGIASLRKLLSKPLKKFEIIFKVEIPPTIAVNIKFIDPEKIKLTDDIKDVEAKFFKGLKPDITSFAKKTYRFPKYLRINVQTLDAFTALEIARVTLSENLDLIHLGYSNETVFPDKKVMIVEETRANNYYFQVRPLNYDLDGIYRDGLDLYNQFSKNLSDISIKSTIKTETKEKLKSAIRYLRLGNEAIEVEHKFLNYWIAMEYLFADMKDKSDIADIKKYFSRIHGNIYLKRLLHDFHWNLIRLKVSSGVPSFDMGSLSYLENEATYNHIISKHSSNLILLSHRAEKLKRILFPAAPPSKGEPTDMEILINKHISDLELHLSRMYRIRNTIIHNAAINMDIISTTSNLRYYLTFILSSAITELTENPSICSIEDFFLSQEIIFNSLKEEKFPKEKLFAIKTHFDLIA